MLKQNLQWKGPTGQPMNKTFYFNLTRYEISAEMELEKLESRFKKFQEEVVGPEGSPSRDMTPPEIREMLDIVKTIIKYAYGVLDEGPDGVEFNKEDSNIWRRFVATGAFDAFVWYLFDNPERANSFMTGIWPEEVRKEVEDEQRRQNIHAVQDISPPGEVNEGTPIAPDDGIPSIEENVPVLAPVSTEKEWYAYDEAQLLELSDKEFEILYAQSRAGKNVPPMMLTIRQRRKQREGGETE